MLMFITTQTNISFISWTNLRKGQVRVMVFNATFSNTSVISWRSVLLVEETGVQEKTTYLPQVIDKFIRNLPMKLMWGIVVLNATLNNISVISWSQFYWWWKPEKPLWYVQTFLVIRIKQELLKKNKKKFICSFSLTFNQIDDARSLNNSKFGDCIYHIQLLKKSIP